MIGAWSRPLVRGRLDSSREDFDRLVRGQLLAADELLPGLEVGREAERRLGAPVPLRVSPPRPAPCQ